MNAQLDREQAKGKTRDGFDRKVRPQLKNGRLVPQGNRLVFETDEPFDQIILPIEVIDFVTQCNGDYTVAEIIENIYHQRNTIQFKLIYSTLIQLKERGFLENGDDLEVASEVTTSARRFRSFSPLWQFYLGRRIINDREHPLLFYALSMIVCVMAILSSQEFDSSWLNLGFLHYNDSYLFGFNYLFIGASILLSLKNMLKCAMLVFLTGRVYNFSLTFNGFALYFRVTSDSLFLVTNKLFLSIFHFATIFCYFAFVYVGNLIWPDSPILNLAYALAMVLTILEINPFQASEISTYFKSIFNNDNLNRFSAYMKSRSILAVANPLQRTNDQGLFFTFIHSAFIWGVFANLVLVKAVSHHFDPLMVSLRSGLTFETLSALACLTILMGFLIITTSNLANLVYLSLFSSAHQVLQSYRRQTKSKKVEFFNAAELRGVLENLPLFSYFSPEVLETIISKGEVRECQRNAPIMVEGDASQDLFVLLSGRIETRQRLPSGHLQKVNGLVAPSIFGEDAILGDGVRQLEVVAVENSVVLAFPAELLKSFAKNEQHLREITAFKNAVSVNHFFTSAPLFRELEEEVVHLFTARGKIEDYKKDQIIFKQGDPGDGFYLLLRGRVGVVVNNRAVARIQEGGFFGEISVIADVPRTGTIYAMQDTQVLRISREAFWEILAKDLTMAMFIESVGEMRVREDVEVLRAKAS